ncbi:sulfotransferase family 2 domain-containing protein [Thiohalocapsa sp. ML1]|uniref:sulfotransferase family 2 domain-containing protein n=1 Tax=Thiohalocapsa sp. ML1 TaxID=1431688 RepID=UPI000AD92C3C|nr:sulfotransferase family 2 domain-containing protein [Thiohalocapsa sp. ML1]
MLSMRHQCIFVRVSKAASTSVQDAFKADTRPGDGGYFDIKHHTLDWYRANYPDHFPHFYKFTFVRNPWDRIYSQYRFQRHVMIHKLPEMFAFAQCSFRDWLLQCADAYAVPNRFLFGVDRAIFGRHLTNQLDWVTLDGEIAVDFIGRFEHLDADFAKVCEALGAPLALPKHNVTPSSNDYRDAYDDETRALVAQWHARDIAHFGYTF